MGQPNNQCQNALSALGNQAFSTTEPTWANPPAFLRIMTHQNDNRNGKIPAIFCGYSQVLDSQAAPLAAQVFRDEPAMAKMWFILTTQ